jgi:hypothetical protein
MARHACLALLQGLAKPAPWAVSQKAAIIAGANSFTLEYQRLIP